MIFQNDINIGKDDYFNIDVGNPGTEKTTTGVPPHQTSMQPGTTISVFGIKAQPIDEDGNPLEGAEVTLQCKDPKGEFVAVEDPAGEYTFERGIPGDGRIECDLVVEKEGYVNFRNLKLTMRRQFATGL